jgi:hypothetical protein
VCVCVCERERERERERDYCNHSCTKIVDTFAYDSLIQFWLLDIICTRFYVIVVTMSIK